MNSLTRQRFNSLFVSFLFVSTSCFAQDTPTPWQDPSKHNVQFVEVEKGIQLEVLDWGGNGQPVVLLTGSGNSAHIYDDFAIKLTDCCHVYAITRRGFGKSTHPDTGYTNKRFAEDVLEVIHALRINKPVLVGHSMAFRELTVLGAEHGDQLSGLVYLDAGPNPYDDDPSYRALVQKLPQSMQSVPPATDVDRKSVVAFSDWFMRTRAFTFPEAEFRNTRVINPDGSVGTPTTARTISEAISKEPSPPIMKSDLPALSLVTTPPETEDENQVYRPTFRPKNAEERAAVQTLYDADRKWFQDIKTKLETEMPKMKLVAMPGATHYLFISSEAEVLREIKAFLAKLP